VKAVRGEVIERRPARHREHPHSLTSGLDIHRHPVPQDDKHAKPTLRHATAVERSLALLPPEMLRSEDEIFDELIERGQKPAHAAIQAHREMAATILAAGGTFEEAGDHAGVSAGTVGKFYEEESFRQRVEEMRAVVLSEVQGRIVADLKRRILQVDKMELTDVLRVYDRTVGTAGRNKGSTVNVGNLTVNNATYDTILAKISLPDADEEGGDLQGSGFDLVPLPSRGP
ncbi:MAG: hypothetical protein M3R04_08565, partial [bacterium]|nr:hypothetical protein [bacterium]